MNDFIPQHQEIRPSANAKVSISIRVAILFNNPPFPTPTQRSDEMPLTHILKLQLIVLILITSRRRPLWCFLSTSTV